MGKWRYSIAVFMLIMLCFFTNQAQLAGIIDIAKGDQDVTIYGADDNDFSNPFLDGFDSLAVGDINGDGIEDLIFGAPLADGPENRRLHAGEVYVIFGPLPTEFDLARTQPDITIIGANEGDNLGVAVASGDLDNDGFDDIIIGAPSADSLRNERKDAGEVYIFFGGTNLPKTIDLATTPPDAVILGADTGDNLGLSLVSGDINGDSLADIIIGAPAASGRGNAHSGAGEVYVIFGGFSFTSIDLALNKPDLIIFGADIGDHLGVGLAVGDLNADGIGDLVIGASAGDGPGNSRDNAGEVYVIYGSPNPPTMIDLASGSAGLTIWGGAVGDRLGLAVAVGDINGDGIDDIAAGAFAADGLNGKRANAGAVYLIYGAHDLPAQLDLSLEGADVIIFGADVGDNLGVSLALSDIDHDGKADIFIGAPGGDGPQGKRRNAGEAYLIFGSSLLPRIVDLSDTQVDHVTIFGRDPGDNLGISVTSGDLDGDGLNDLVVEAVNADGPGNRKVNSGEIYAIMGSNFATPNTPPIADAGPNQQVIVGATVQLDGSNSKDPDGDPLSFSWQFVSRPEGSTALLSNPNIARPSFVADKAGDYVLQLTVSDGRGGSDTAQVTITAVRPSRLKGDVDGDGDIDINDARLAAEYIAGLRDLTEEQKWAADVHEPCRPPDAHIDVTDVRWIAEYFLGLEHEMFCYTSSAAKTTGASNSAGMARIRVVSRKRRLTPGETFKVRLIATHIKDSLTGAQAGSEGALTFDPQIIQVKHIKSSNLYQLLAYKIDNIKGKVRFVIISTGRVPRDGAFAEIEMIARARGESKIKLTGLHLVDARGQRLKVTIIPAKIDVGASTDKFPSDPSRIQVRVIPGMVTRSTTQVQFQVAGKNSADIKNIQVTVYDLAGRRVYNSVNPSGTLRWPLVDDEGRTPANGVYLYIITVRDADGAAITEIGKLIILR